MSGKSIGLRIGSLIRQYGLRIAYAKGKISLYEAERAKYESLGRQRQAASAKLSRNVWAAYCNAITAKRDALMEDVRQLLSGYTGIEYDVWVRHCVNGERMSDIANDLGYNLTWVYKIAAKVSADMAERIEEPEKPTSSKAPKWTARQLAKFLTEAPSPDYEAAIADLLAYGAIDVGALESDGGFQDYLLEGRDDLCNGRGS